MTIINKVLVNCQMGVSRSSAMAMAYMILYRYGGRRLKTHFFKVFIGFLMISLSAGPEPHWIFSESSEAGGT